MIVTTGEIVAVTVAFLTGFSLEEVSLCACAVTDRLIVSVPDKELSLTTEAETPLP